MSALAGADRLADADLAGALGDRHQHDVHDADAADQQRDADDGAHHRGDAAEDRGVGLEDLLLERGSWKSFSSSSRGGGARAAGADDLSLTWSTDSLERGLEPELHLVGGAAAEDLQRGVERDEDQVVGVGRAISPFFSITPMTVTGVLPT